MEIQPPLLMALLPVLLAQSVIDSQSQTLRLNHKAEAFWEGLWSPFCGADLGFQKQRIPPNHASRKWWEALRFRRYLDYGMDRSPLFGRPETLKSTSSCGLLPALGSPAESLLATPSLEVHGQEPAERQVGHLWLNR